MPKKRMPVGRKATGNRRRQRHPLQVAVLWITDRIPILVIGPERALTWAGELVKHRRR
jgi:hypothetical protein